MPVPLIHTTDLYHPNWDPDDQVDLGVVYALPELDLRGDIIRALFEDSMSGSWRPVVKGATRTHSREIMFARAAGRRLRKTAAGWRFLAQDRCEEGQEEFEFTLRPVDLAIDDDGHTAWSECEASTAKLVYLEGPYALYAEAMGQATNGLLREIPVEPEGARGGVGSLDERATET
jgi:hypothetical protein